MSEDGSCDHGADLNVQEGSNPSPSTGPFIVNPVRDLRRLADEAGGYLSPEALEMAFKDIWNGHKPR